LAGGTCVALFTSSLLVSCDFEPSEPALPPRAAAFFFAGFAAALEVLAFAFAGLADFPAFDAFAFAGFEAFDAFDALALLLFFGFAMSLRPPAGC
jgi:hypothetical protein